MRFNRRWHSLWLLAAGMLLAWCAGADARTGAHSPIPDAAPVISIHALPADALQALARIRSGGPFPYERDGAVFNNYERLLPARPRGYYREYTVAPAGSAHRGTRRFIVGCERGAARRIERDAGNPAFRDCSGPAELYYTEDHYRSFRKVVP